MAGGTVIFAWDGVAAGVGGGTALNARLVKRRDGRHAGSLVWGPAAGLTARRLASAARGLGRDAGALRDRESGELLHRSGVNAHGFVKSGLRGAELHRDPKTLRHLARIWADDMEADHALTIVDVADELGIAGFR